MSIPHYLIQVFFQEQSKKRKAKKPRLYIDDIKSTQNRSSPQTPYLHIYGDVWNVGKSTAYNCRLKVEAYQGTVKAIDTETSLGSIGGNRNKKVDENIYYNGEPLTRIIKHSKWTEKKKKKKKKKD